MLSDWLYFSFPFFSAKLWSAEAERIIFVPQISAMTKKKWKFPARLVSTSADVTKRNEFYLVGRKD